MKNNKSTHELYQCVFDEVHAPKELLRKVESMSKVKTHSKSILVKKMVFIVASAAVMLIASNAIVYAATGSSWIEHIIVHMTYDGNSQDVDVTKTVDNNGNVTYDMQTDDNDDQHFAFSIDDDKQIVDGDSIEVQDADYSAVLTEEGGRIYYISNDLEIKKDITEDFFDGTATFTAPDNMGNKIIVKITGNLEEYSIAYTEG